MFFYTRPYYGTYIPLITQLQHAPVSWRMPYSSTGLSSGNLNSKRCVRGLPILPHLVTVIDRTENAVGGSAPVQGTNELNVESRLRVSVPSTLPCFQRELSLSRVLKLVPSFSRPYLVSLPYSSEQRRTKVYPSPQNESPPTATILSHCSSHAPSSRCGLWRPSILHPTRACAGRLWGGRRFQQLWSSWPSPSCVHHQQPLYYALFSGQQQYSLSQPLRIHPKRQRFGSPILAPYQYLAWGHNSSVCWCFTAGSAFRHRLS